MANYTNPAFMDAFIKSADAATARTNLGLGTASNVTFSAVTGSAYIINSNALITESTTARTLSAGDDGKIIICTNASAVTITVPAGLGAGFSCGFIQAGAGAITFSASGTTLNAVGGGLATSAQHSMAAILATAANVFNVSVGGGGGDVTFAVITADAYRASSALIVTESTTARTIGASDNGKTIICTNASATVITVPSGLGAAFSCTVIQRGAGQVSFAESGVAIDSLNDYVKIAGRYGSVSLLAVAADTFNLDGALTA